MISETDFAPIAALDLSAIKAKLMHKAGEGWSLVRANAVEREYRRFLLLMKAFPGEDTAPLVDVDTFWHYHILDTMKYAADSEQVFGYFLHHYPYVGMGGEDDEQVRIASGERMRELYEATFAEAYPAPRADRTADQASAKTAFCGAAVKADSAYCGVAAQAQTAFCGVAAKTGTAYCGVAIKAGAAYCGVAVKAATAYCGVATPTAGGRHTAPSSLAA